MNANKVSNIICKNSLKKFWLLIAKADVKCIKKNGIK